VFEVFDVVEIVVELCIDLLIHRSSSESTDEGSRTIFGIYEEILTEPSNRRGPKDFSLPLAQSPHQLAQRPSCSQSALPPVDGLTLHSLKEFANEVKSDAVVEAYQPKARGPSQRNGQKP
jgi:hypothetical protein